MGKVAPIGVALVSLALLGCGATTSTSIVTSGTAAAPAVTQAGSITTTATQPPTTQAVTSTTVAAPSVTLKWGGTFLNQKVSITIPAPTAVTFKDGSKGAVVSVTMKNLSQETLYYSQMVFVLFDTLGSSSGKQSLGAGGEPYENEQPGKTLYGELGFGLAEGAQPKSVVVTWPEILGDTQLIWQ